MVDQAIKRDISRTPSVTTTRFPGRQLVTLAIVVVAAVAVALALVPVSVDTKDAAVPSQAETARWEALVAAEYPGASARVVAQADRWTALAAAYQNGTILTPGRLAEMARWEAMAGQALRSQTTVAARWNGLAAHHLAQTPGNQAWADRYQGLADTAG